MIEINNKKECCGCAACMNICPYGCITMVEDEEGFLYPNVDKGKCINCGLCNMVCPMMNNKVKNKKAKEVYACINKDKKVLLNSSSGGVFAALALSIIKENGIVYGALYNDSMEVVHKSIDCQELIIKLQGSKYVESKIDNCFKEIKKYLNNNKKILFSGTPCQVAGLKTYLKKDYDNLFTCDFICTGVPSRKIFKAYRDYYQAKYKSKLTNIEFRHKKNGWLNFGVLFSFNKKKKYQLRYENAYINALYNQLIIRPSCYACQFKDIKSGSDIKLGDYWFIKNKHPEFYNYNGVSSVIICSKKGQKLFNKVRDQFYIQSSSYKALLDTNKALNTVSKEPKNRKEFFVKIKDASDEEIIKYLNMLMKKNLKERLYYFLFVLVCRIKK
ncbi:MAG: Coenzyme F420 hydrogenase/dehydrogenase, beta subunit C-terminal domain [Bacilli bacterium]|nr:Coenzyme F420 hydrogenase/dehydrogenase, beta subunit C-terminal domain [Bacilli bacterium]